MVAPKNGEAGFCAGLNPLAETFSLYKSLSSPQQLIAVNPHSTDKFFPVNTRKLAWNEIVNGLRFFDDVVTHITQSPKLLAISGFIYVVDDTLPARLRRLSTAPRSAATEFLVEQS